MYGFVKLSNVWYGKKFPTFRKAETWAGEIARNGEVAMLADDVEYFASELGIEKDDITW